jgi:hypothetical protein
MLSRKASQVNSHDRSFKSGLRTLPTAMQSVSKMSGGLNHLMKLSAQEDFTEFCHHENFKIYIIHLFPSMTLFNPVQKPVINILTLSHNVTK